MKQYGEKSFWPHVYGHLRPFLKKRFWRVMRKEQKRVIRREVCQEGEKQQ